ncbi:hypothetical protein [Pandoraea pulmonicola]|uniref:hypothetical protein n=1 Tax=Pandoraea pulmonicola TaxID=93221 RepID=UPI0011C06168|nr:hypothetical protein [Pandoraea pulmonicola]
MSIGSISSNHSKATENPHKKTPSLEQDRSTLQSDLKFVRNALSKVYEDIAEAHDAKERGKSLLSSLVEISQNNGKNSIARLKNGTLKFGYGDNIIKNFISKDRYKSERKEAARYLGLPGDKVSAADAMSKITNEIKKLDEFTKKLSHDECRFKIEEEKISYQLKIKDDLYKNFSSIEESARKLKT